MVQKTALAFVEAINRHDVDGILSLMSADHVFIDAYGARQSGEEMRRGWPGYFAWFPDYSIAVEQVMAAGDTVALFGHAQGTYRGKPGPDGAGRWRIPAAWRVVVSGETVQVWQVYADSKLPYESMQADAPGLRQRV